MEETVHKFMIYIAITWRQVWSRRKIYSDAFSRPVLVLFAERRMVKLNVF
jgi:hypothetical protein